MIAFMLSRDWSELHLAPGLTMNRITRSPSLMVERECSIVIVVGNRGDCYDFANAVAGVLVVVTNFMDFRHGSP